MTCKGKGARKFAPVNGLRDMRGTCGAALARYARRRARNATDAKGRWRTAQTRAGRRNRNRGDRSARGLLHAPEIVVRTWRAVRQSMDGIQ